jgi:hypothetical protein
MLLRMLWHFVEMSMILSVPSIKSLQEGSTAQQQGHAQQQAQLLSNRNSRIPFLDEASLIQLELLL